MNYLEMLVQELFEYKKGEDLNPITLLNFAYDMLYAEEKLNKGVLRQLRYIEENTSSKLLVPLAVVDFIYGKQKGRAKSTGMELVVKDNNGNPKFLTLGELIKHRSEAMREISKSTAIIANQYAYHPKLKEAQGSKGTEVSETVGLEELRRKK